MHGKMAVQTRGSAQTGAVVTENSIRRIDLIVQVIHVVSADISRLNSQSDSMAEMVETIRGFAIQTRLIALNAAIVVARAGTSGSSFTIVAAEAHNLMTNVSGLAKPSSSLFPVIISWPDKYSLLFDCWPYNHKTIHL